MNADNDDAPAPELADVQQQAPALEPLVTRVDGTVRTHVLPSRSGASRNYKTSASSAPVILLGQDMRRRRATIFAEGDTIYVGARDDCVNETAARWPQGVPLVVEHTEQIYVRAAAGDAIVSVISENWAD